MTTKQVFEIRESLPNKNVWLVRGRAYEDLQVGESVFIEGQKTSGNRAYLEFKITSIITYQTELQFLDGGVTGQLTLEGPNEEILKNATHLLKISRADD